MSQAGRVVTLRSATSGCTVETYTVTTAAGGVTAVLPYGAWTISAVGSNVVSQTLSGSNKAPTVTLTVTA